MTLAPDAPLWWYRDAIKYRVPTAHGVMLSFSEPGLDRKGNPSVSHVMSPSLVVGSDKTGYVEGSFDWMGPLLVWWPDGDASLGLARRPTLGQQASCITLPRPACFLEVRDTAWCRAVLCALLSQEPLPSQPGTARSLFSLALDHAVQSQGSIPAQQDFLRLAEVFLVMGAVPDVEDLDRFSDQVDDLCKQGSGPDLDPRTRAFVKRHRLSTLVVSESVPGRRPRLSM